MDMWIIRNTSFMMILAIFFGFLFDLSFMKNYLIIILAIAMYFSLLEFSIKKFKLNKKVLLLLFLNYIIYSVVILTFSFLLLREDEYLIGILISTTLPPAVMIIPYVFLFGGEKENSLLAEFISYFLTFLIIPIMFYIIQKQMYVSHLIIQLLILIVLPFVASRLIKNEKIKSYNKEIVNLCIFLINASVISVNKKELSSLVSFHPIWVIVMIKVIFLPFFVYLLTKKMKKFSISLTIFSSLKNSTLGIVIAMNLFSPATSIPLILFNLSGAIYPLLFSFLFKKLNFNLKVKNKK